jgi:hypothetical protein
LLGGIACHEHADASAAAVGRYCHFGYSGGLNPGIGQFIGDELVELLAHCFGETLGTAGVHVVLLQPLDGGRYEYCAEHDRGLMLDTLQDGLGVKVVTGNRNGCNYRSLPEILMIDLSHRDVELMTEPVFQPLHYVPLVFERVRLVKPKLKR